MSLEEDQLLAHLLKEKETERVEIEMQLFENCNLSCAFCSQDHKASLEQTSLPSLMRKVELVRSFIADHTMKDFKFNLMGGEIFQDAFDDEHLQRLGTFVQALVQICDAHGKTAQFMFTTNLLFETSDRVERFIVDAEKTAGPITLATSFDFVGRNWSSRQKELFKNNIEYFSRRIHLVGVVLHKLSIEKMLKQRDPLFDWLYERVPLVFEYYIPDLKQQDRFSPSDDDNLQAWRYLAQNYPRVDPVHRWLKNDYNEVKCCSLNRLTVLADDSISTCRYMPYKASDFKTHLDRNSISEMALSFVKEQNCLTCGYFSRCGLHCFVQADRAKREKNESCFIRRFFDESLNSAGNVNAI